MNGWMCLFNGWCVYLTDGYVYLMADVFIIHTPTSIRVLFVVISIVFTLWLSSFVARSFVFVCFVWVCFFPRFFTFLSRSFQKQIENSKYEKNRQSLEDGVRQQTKFSEEIEEYRTNVERVLRSVSTCINLCVFLGGCVFCCCCCVVVPCRDLTSHLAVRLEYHRPPVAAQSIT